MSNTLHYAKKHEIVYGDKSAFNYKQSDINYLLDEITDGNCYCQNGDIGTANYLHIDSDSLREGLELLESNDEYRAEMSSSYPNIDINEFIEVMRNFEENADDSDGYIYLGWF